MPPAQLSFASWARRGLAAAIDRPDTSPAGAPDTRVRIDLEFNNDPGRFTSTTQLTLVGPGDIVGLDPRSIVRIFPRPDDNDAEADFFAMIELDQPDLPWRYTPARAIGDRAAASDQLRPWLNLIVLAEGDEVDLARDLLPASAARKLPVLNVQTPALLPELSESWAWAHVHVNGPISEDPNANHDAELGQPGTVARVLCPRRLQKNTAYVAFLVPTFKRGVKVGIAATPEEWNRERGTVDALELAWQRPDTEVRLPVYFFWRFQTGSVSSFREAALALQGTSALDASVGQRELDVRDPGLELDPPSVAPPPPAPQEPPHLLLGGALQSLAARNSAEPTLRPSWISGLKQFVDAPILEVDGVPTRVVAPPLYGRWHAAQPTLDAPPPPGAPPPSNPRWFFTMNTDPRFRVPAALGTEVVQRDQEALMTSAWAQIESLERINQERRVMQTGVHAFESLLGRHIQIGPIESVLTTTTLVHGRVRFAGATAFGALDRSPLGIGLMDPAWRRIASPVGTIGRRLGLSAAAPGQSTNLFDRVNTGAFEPAPPAPTLPGTRTSADAYGPVVPGGLSGPQIDALIDRLGRDQLTFFGLLLFWVARHLLLSGQGRYWWLLHQLLRLGLDLIRLATDPQRQRLRLWQGLRDGPLTVTAVDDAPPNPGFTVRDTVPDLNDPASLPPAPVPPAPGATDSPDGALFRAALRGLAQYLNRDFTPRPTPQPVDLLGLRGQLLNALGPRANFAAEAGLRHLRDPSIPWNPQDPLEPIQAAPSFPEPMCEPLGSISPEWLLPNLGQVPRNSVSALVVNQRFIEAYMVGLSHEMARELLWNRYPTDQRGTYFRQFWDPRGFIPADPAVPRPPEQEKDIFEIHTWPKASPLGTNSPRQPFDPAVVLIRGDVIKRYPNLVVYLARAPAASAAPPRVPDDNAQLHPVFQGRLGGDAGYFGFARTPAQLRDEGGTGWYVVIQERPSEPKFAIPQQGPEVNVPVSEIPGALSSGQAARLTFRFPTRVAIHASELVPA